jgi:hypothetical protein
VPDNLVVLLGNQRRHCERFRVYVTNSRAVGLFFSPD